MKKSNMLVLKFLAEHRLTVDEAEMLLNIINEEANEIKCIETMFKKSTENIQAFKENTEKKFKQMEPGIHEKTEKFEKEISNALEMALDAVIKEAENMKKKLNKQKDKE